MNYYLILLLAITCFVGPLEALYCHTCDTATGGQSDCADPFNAGGKYALQCPAQASAYCVKSNLGGRVVRSCSNSCTNGLFCCQGDNCNSSNNFKPNKIMAGIFLLAATGLTLFKFL